MFLDMAGNIGRSYHTAHDLTTDEVIRIASVFAKHDKNSDGIIDMEELGELLGALGRARRIMLATSRVSIQLE